LRVEVPAVKRSAATARNVENLLQIAGVRQASANPWTGNVLVLYDTGRTTQEAILAILEREGFLARGGKKARGEDTSAVGTVIAQKLVQFVVELVLQRLLYVALL
jgi:hypothetical protein